jgi:hypothetical protein
VTGSRKGFRWFRYSSLFVINEGQDATPDTSLFRCPTLGGHETIDGHPCRPQHPSTTCGFRYSCNPVHPLRDIFGRYFEAQLEAGHGSDSD